MSDTTRTTAGIRRVTAAAAAIFAVTIVLVQRDLTDDFDRHVLEALRSDADINDPVGPAWVEESATDITSLGGYPLLILFVLAALAVLSAHKHYSASLFLAGSVFSGSVLSTGLKLFFDRPRPDLVDHLDRTFTSSFPSAHAMVSAVVWFTMAAIVVRFSADHRMRCVVLGFALVVVLLVGVSRVYLGVHWPTDVIAGWSCGIAWAGGCWLAANYFSRARDPKVDLGRADL